MAKLDSHLFPADPDYLLLDIGPGDGEHAETFAQDRRVVAVEIDEALARTVARRRSPWQLTSCRGDAHQLPIRLESVDGAVIIEVLEHVEDPDEILAETFRVLKPSGSLCVAVPTSYTETVYSRLHPRYLSNATHVRVFKKDELCRRIEEQGFVVSHVITENLEPAIAWLVHALLRSDADPTGRVLEHTGIDRVVRRAIRRLEKTRGFGRSVSLARRHLGKSWYVFASKPPAGDAG